jgi:hypothetical protein
VSTSDNDDMVAAVPVPPGGAIAGGYSPTEVIGVGSAMMGVPQVTAISVPHPEPGLHPPPDSSLLVFEGLMAGIAIGAIYVFSRAVGETFKL